MASVTSMTIPTQIKRVMLFVDGKNLAARFNGLKESGKRPFEKVEEIKDTFVWIPFHFEHPKSLPMGLETYDIIRGYYFTYFVCDVALIREYIEKIKNTQIRMNTDQTFLPRVIKKDRSERDVKGDDIGLTVIALHHAFHQHMDIMHLFTGDGDYIPLVEEVQRLGIRVYVSAFSLGLNNKLRLTADKFFELDRHFFYPDV